MLEREQQLAAQHLALLLIYCPVGLLRVTNDTAGGPGVPQGQEGQGHIVWGVLQPRWQLA